MTDETAEPGRSPRRLVLDALPDTIASGATGLVDLTITGIPSAGTAAPVLGAR